MRGPEAEIQKHIIELLRDKLEFNVWETSQGYRKDPGGTRMTPGIPDLIIAGHGHTLFVEVKAPKGGRLTDMQYLFRVRWTESGGTSLVWRSDSDAWDWCVSEGIIEETDEVA